MPEQVHPPGTDGIQILPAGVVLEPDAFAAADRDHRQRFVVPHLAARVPDDREVTARERQVIDRQIVHGGAAETAFCRSLLDYST